LIGDREMELLNAAKTGKKQRPIKVLQFGEGNFLRAFVDYFIDRANEAGKFDGDIVLVKPIDFGNLDMFHAQDCQYTVCLRGIVDGEPKVEKRIITSVADAVDAYKEYAKYSDYAKLDSLRYIVSNTTEAGIVYDDTDRFEAEPPKTYPGKLCKLLYTRYKHFDGALDKGLVILPVELIDDNGLHLKECVVKFAKLWNLEEDFLKWLDDACVFTQTLVDRIVTGYPRDDAEELWKEFGYQDNIVVTAEPFGLWVIESSKDISKEFPLPDAGLPVIFTEDHHPYKQRKVRILNGAHTSFVLAAYLAGYDYVRESLEDELIGDFMHKTIYDEVIPTLDLPKEDLLNFAEAVDGRFKNPYIKHALLSISLNSVSKWRARCMPSLLGYVERKGELPKHLTFSIAALMAFYTGSEIRDKALIGNRDGQEYKIMDDAAVLEFFAANSSKATAEFVHAYLSNVDFHGQDLTLVAGLEAAVVAYLDDIRTIGMRKAIEKNFQ
jgi:tagaturonate reductase